MPRINPPDAPPDDSLPFPAELQIPPLPVSPIKALALVRRYYAYGEKYQEIARRYTGVRSYRAQTTLWGRSASVAEAHRVALWAGLYTPYGGTRQFLGLDPNWVYHGWEPNPENSATLWAIWGNSWYDLPDWETNGFFAAASPIAAHLGSQGGGVSDWRMEELAYWRTYVPRSDLLYPEINSGWTEPIGADPLRRVKLEWQYLVRIIHQMLFVAVRQQEDRLLRLTPGDPADTEAERAMHVFTVEPISPIEGVIHDAYARVAGTIQAFRIQSGDPGL